MCGLLSKLTYFLCVVSHCHCCIPESGQWCSHTHLFTMGRGCQQTCPWGQDRAGKGAGIGKYVTLQTKWLEKPEQIILCLLALWMEHQNDDKHFNNNSWLCINLVAPWPFTFWGVDYAYLNAVCSEIFWCFLVFSFLSQSCIKFIFPPVSIFCRIRWRTGGTRKMYMNRIMW